MRPVWGVCAMRKRPTCVGPATTPSTSGTSVVRKETTPVPALDWRRKETTSRRSSPSGSAGADGKRRKAARPTADTATVAIACATTSAAIVSVTPYGAAIAIAPRRSSIANAWYAPRRS